MVTVGSPLPAPPKSLWEVSPNKSVTFPETGKFIIVGLPGAFTRESLTSSASWQILIAV